MRTPSPPDRAGPLTPPSDATLMRRPPTARRVLLAYYAATPVFALLDLAVGVNVRVTFFDATPALKLTYYLVAFACAGAIWRWPDHAARVGLVESGANIALLVLGVGLAYLRLLDAAGAEGPMPLSPLRGPEVINLVVSAAVLAFSYLMARSRDRPAVRG